MRWVATMLSRGISAEREGGSEAYRQGYATGTFISAFVVCAAAAWGVWAYLRRADRPATAAIKTALAAKLTASTDPTGAEADPSARDLAIRDAEAWAANEAGALNARRYARASWMYTLLVLPLGACGNTNGALFKLAISIFGCLILLAAIGLAIYALTQVRRRGRKGLLVPAVVTLVANALMVGLAVWGILDRR